jgi:UDP-glucose 4-epimerase
LPVVVPDSLADTLKYDHNNTAALRSVVESAVAQIIFSSTAATYGMYKSMPVTKNSLKLPINPHGMSKP